MPVGDGFGTAGFTILDESGRFNLNALSTNPQSAEGVMRQQMFQGILQSAGLDPNLLYPVLDWLDPGDDTDRESGAESPYYLGLKPPYVPRNARMLRLEELLLVKGFDQLTYEQWTVLRDVLTVLPNDELRINVNTAPELLLKALFDALGGPSVAVTILEQRSDHAFTEARELQATLTNYIPPLAIGKFGIRSSYFTIYATGSAGDVERHLAVTEQIRREQFPPRVTLLDWREAPRPVSLTSAEPSGGMTSALP
jgi:general secretion pathway protein K